ncbi:hypothetical protein AXF42_Ash014150 [Apostasia shenzhenica]|uniref:Uncharacterized protein n=1 Tax=Apostasia shenzhenica TaxID=1088818 RepID=A0A2I0A131_9ASPA|nr:hypothetical protein AXF42_Ash014150 [Apostasia shenzhenica]
MGLKRSEAAGRLDDCQSTELLSPVRIEEAEAGGDPMAPSPPWRINFTGVRLPEPPESSSFVSRMCLRFRGKEKVRVKGQAHPDANQRPSRIPGSTCTAHMTASD